MTTIRAVGFVAVYSCYIEDRLIELIKSAEKFISLKKNIKRRGIKDQAKFLRVHLQLPNYLAGLQQIENLAKTRMRKGYVVSHENNIMAS